CCPASLFPSANLYSHTTSSFSHSLLRFSTTHPPYSTFRKCRSCAEMLAGGYFVLPANSSSVIHCSCRAAIRSTISSVSRCVLPGRNIPSLVPARAAGATAAPSLSCSWLIPRLLLKIRLLFEVFFPRTPIRVLVIPRAPAACPHG